MANILSKTILRDWGGINVIANIDEGLEDVKVAVKYSDHGDDFLFVKTKDGKAYEYGWYVGRRDVFCPDYDELITSQNDWGFIRKPELYFAYDKRSRLSNEICFYVMRRFEDVNYRTKIDKSQYAQVKFNEYVDFMKEVYSRGITYHKEQDKRKIERYLKENGISTQENLEILHSVKFTSGKNGIDGTAGKRKAYRTNKVVGDHIGFIWYDGEILSLKDVKIKSYYDREYFERFDLSLNQFN